MILPMVRITKVTTKTGDKGLTTLAGGQQVPKTSPRIEAYGGVDELNSFLGLVAELLREQPKLAFLRHKILRIQNELFDLGSQLAVLPQDRRENTPVIREQDIQNLEAEIIEMNGQLQPLRSFVLPGGDLVACYLHIARTVCRRVERNIVLLSQTEPLDGVEIPYINRLSDWLFVVSRLVSKELNREEILWQPGNRNSE
jgi:cob(I)alamin adenosyltransferase